MTRNTRSKSVPKNMQATYEAIVGLTDAFCDPCNYPHLSPLKQWLAGFPQGGVLLC